MVTLKVFYEPAKEIDGTSAESVCDDFSCVVALIRI